MSLNDSASQKWLTVNQRYSPLQRSHKAHIQRTNTTRRQQLFAMTRQGILEPPLKTASLHFHYQLTQQKLCNHPVCSWLWTQQTSRNKYPVFLFCYSDISKFSGASYWPAFNDLKIFLVQQCAWQFGLQGVASCQVHRKTAMGHSKFYSSPKSFAIIYSYWSTLIRL